MSSNLTPSPSDITEGDVNALKLFMACRRGGPIATTFALVFKHLSNLNPGTTVAEHCENYYKQNPTKKNVFKKELHDLQTCQPEDLDITMLHKLLCHVCDINLIQNILTEIKKQRNFLCHEVVKLSDKDLSDRFLEIRNHLQAIENQLNIDLAPLMNELQNILASPAQRVIARDIEAQQRAIREDIERGFIEDCSNELQDRYSKMKVMTPITWLEHHSLHNITVDKVFTELKILETTTRITVKEVLKVEREAGKPSNRVIITGVTGAGKTSLCRYLMYCWGAGLGVVDKIEGLNEVKLLIFIQCRFVHSDNLLAYLQEDILHGSLYSLERSKVIPILKKVNPLFIIDGYEEANETTKNVIKQIHNCFPNSKMVISSRPHILSELKAKLAFDGSQVNKTLTLQIEGLDKKNEIEFVRKLFGVLEPDPSVKSSVDSFVSLVESNKWNKLEDILKLPLTLALLILLWVDDESSIDEISTEGQIHFKIIEMTKKRLAERLTTEISQVETFCGELGKVALDVIRQGKQRCLDPDSVSRLEKDFSNVSGEMMSSFLACETHDTLTTSKKVWSFIHAAQQEMLAALHVKEQTIVNDNYPFWKELSNCSGSDSEFSSELLRSVVLKSMELLASSEKLGSVVEAVVKGFPPKSEQNSSFIEEMLKLCGPIDEKIIVGSLKEHFDASQLCRWIGSTHVPIITELVRKRILPPETELTFHVVDLDYESFVRDLNSFNCTPTLMIDVSLEDQLAQLLAFLSNTSNDLKLHIVLEFRRSCSEKVFADLVKKWNWSEPMRICCSTFESDLLCKLPGIIGPRLIKIACEGSGNAEVVNKMKLVAKRSNITFEEIPVHDDKLVISFQTE